MILTPIVKLYFLFQKISSMPLLQALKITKIIYHKDCEQKEEGVRRMQPGRPAYPHWGSSHPPTSAQTPTRNQKRPQNDKEDATDSLQQLIAFLLERLIKSLSILNGL